MKFNIMHWKYRLRSHIHHACNDPRSRDCGGINKRRGGFNNSLFLMCQMFAQYKYCKKQSWYLVNLKDAIVL